MKNILAQVLIGVSMVLSACSQKTQPAATTALIQPSPFPIKSSPTPSNCVAPVKSDPFEIAKWVKLHPECVFDINSVPFLRSQATCHLSGYPNEDIRIRTLKKYETSLGFSLVILRISSELTHLYFFSQSLIDKKTNDWKFIGEIEPLSLDYNSRLIRGRKNLWVAISDVWGHGSGSSLSGETWYEITSSRLTPVLKFPKYGGEVEGLNLGDYQFDSFIAQPETIQSKTKIHVNYRIKFIVPGDLSNGKLQTFFSKSQHATFIRDDATGEFSLDEAQSDFTKQELEIVYSSNGLGDKNFLKYNFASLTKLASQGSKRQKRILRQCLLKIPSTEQTNFLLSKLH